MAQHLRLVTFSRHIFLWKVWTLSFVEGGEHVMFGERASDDPGHIEASLPHLWVWFHRKNEIVERRVPELCWRIEG